MTAPAPSPAAAATVYFLVHVPKCAGTSVETHFERALGPGFLRVPRWENLLRDVIGNRVAYRPGDERLARLRVASGHSLSVSLMPHLAPRPVEECVLLRAPVSFFISNYNYRVRRAEHGQGPRPPTFDRWYATQRRNPVSSFLLTRYFEAGVPALYRFSTAGRLAWLEARLARFLFVARYTRATELIAGVSERLAIPPAAETMNVSGERYLAREELPAGMQDRILAENALDEALYTRWADRGWREGEAPAGPTGPAPALPRADQLALLASDLGAELRKHALKRFG